jgi:purine-binding chemotaxis protein CheW
MYLDKTQYDSSLDLSLYIEGLFKQDEPKVETETRVDAEELNETLVSEFDIRETEQEITVQSAIPPWGQKPFECLLVKAAGMKLMIPTMSVNYIERVNKKITGAPLETELCQGLITLREKSVAIIDLFSLVVGNDTNDNEQSMRLNTNQVKQAIVMENGCYALSCDDVSQLITLNPEDVRWNRASFNNPMFIGIVTEYLCPIVNIDNLIERVAEMAALAHTPQGLRNRRIICDNSD